MTSSLSSQLKDYIKSNIQEIEQNRVYHSIIFCPLEILSDYIDVLKSIDIIPHSELQDYVKLAEYIATIFGRGKCINVRYEGQDRLQYDFSVPIKLVDYQNFCKGLLETLPHCGMLTNVNREYLSGTLEISIKINYREQNS